MIEYRSEYDRWRWAVLFSCFATKYLNIGLRKSFGVLLLPLSFQFDTDAWRLGMIVSVMVSIGDFSGPVSSEIAKRYGCRGVVMAGGILLFVGMVLAALSTNVAQFTAVLCVFCGLGFSFSNDYPFAVLGEYFQQNFNPANSIAMSGSSLGIIIFGPLTQMFIDIYGWSGAMLLLGGIVFHITAFGALLRPTINNSSAQDIREENYVNTQPLCTDCCRSLGSSPDCSLFKDPLFIAIAIVSTIIRFTQMAWLLYLVPNVVSKGIPSTQASFVSITAGIGDMTGRLLPGFITWVCGTMISGKTVWTVGMAVTSVSLLVAAVVESYIGMMISGAVQGLGLGMMYSSTNVVLFEEFGNERLVNSMGWLRAISGLGRVVGGTLPGLIFHVTNSYSWSFVIIGITQALGIVFLYIGQMCCSHNHP